MNIVQKAALALKQGIMQLTFLSLKLILMNLDI